MGMATLATARVDAAGVALADAADALAKAAATAHITSKRCANVIKAIFRILAFLLLAAGFVAAVMDGARTLANASVTYAALGATLFRLLGERFLLIQPAVERHLHPLLWDPVLLNITLLPTSLVLLGLGFLCYRIGRRGGTGIGHVTRN